MERTLFDELMKVRKAMISVAKRDTAYDADEYDWRKGVSRLTGHCGAAAYVVQHHFGGDILVGRVQDETHYWNRLPDGTEVDLTSDQFGGDGFHTLVDGRISPARKSVNPRFRTFFDRVEKKLKRNK